MDQNRLLNTSHRAIQHVPSVDEPDILISDYPIYRQLGANKQMEIFIGMVSPPAVTGNV